MCLYNGWTNRPTWNVMLWLDNEQAYYNAYTAHRRQHGPYTATTARRFVRRLWPDGKTPDGDSLTRVNWAEIAAALNEE